MNDLLVRPFPIRKIKNNVLRRVTMIVTLPLLWSFAVIVNICWMPFWCLIMIFKCSFVLGGSLVEFWNNPELEKI
jgi:hypothetical protein